jgi:hypothetical protein
VRRRQPEPEGGYLVPKFVEKILLELKGSSVTLPTQAEVERLMKRCQVGCGGPRALCDAHDVMSDCYGTLGALQAEVDRLRAEVARLEAECERRARGK